MTNMVKTKVQRSSKKRVRSRYKSYMVILISLIAVFVVVGGAFGYLAFQVYHHDGIYDGVTAAGVDLSGMTRREAAAALDTRMQAVLDDMTFQVIIDDESFEVTPDELDIQYNADAAAAEAYNF